jgi:hypothetical protein
MIDPSVSSLVALDGCGRGLELTFRVRAGRCVHRLIAIAGTRRADLLESVEGDAQDCWPPSPPWQHVSASPVQGGAAQGGAKQRYTTLLMGAAGVSHWSASVERSNLEGNHGPALEGSGHPPAPGLRFDVACRAKSRPDRLGSTYRMADRSLAVSGCSASECSGAGKSAAGQSVLELRTVLGRYLLRVLPLESTQSDYRQLGLDSCQLVVTGSLVRIVAPSDWSDQRPTTFRWRYQVSLSTV